MNDKYYLACDSDRDGLPDDWEQSCFGNLSQDATDDADNDGCSNWVEYEKRTSSTDSDTDNDGVPDGSEVAHGLNPLFNDAHEDVDGDGYPNLQEYLADTDPNNDQDRLMGDINFDGKLDLGDGILAAQVLAGTAPCASAHKEADVDGDGKIGLDELVYILQKVSGLR